MFQDFRKRLGNDWMMVTMVEKCTQPLMVLYLINGWRFEYRRAEKNLKTYHQKIRRKVVRS